MVQIKLCLDEAMRRAYVREVTKRPRITLKELKRSKVQTREAIDMAAIESMVMVAH